MSHECPECYMVCYCGGDIDDCELNGTDAQVNCTHWKKCEEELDEDFYPEE